MADLTNSVIQRYEQIPANQDVGDRFDHDNFYPFDGVMDAQDDVEFSELWGLKRKSKGGEGIFKGLGRIIKTSPEKEGVSRLEKRLARRNRRAINRKLKRKMRRDARQARRMALLPPPVKTAVSSLEQTGPAIAIPINKTKKGVANPQEENIAKKTVQVADKLANNKDELDVKVVKKELSDVKTSKEAEEKLNEILDPNNDTGKKGWKGLTTPIKVGIIGGSIAVLGLATFLIVKATKK